MSGSPLGRRLREAWAPVRDAWSRHRGRLARAAFVVSLSLLSLGYGLAAADRNWFPNPWFQRAWQQARSVDNLVRTLPAVLPAGLNPWSYRPDPATRTELPERFQPGLTLVSSIWGPNYSRVELRLVDRGGTVHHRWRVPATRLFPAEELPEGVGLQEFRYVHGSHLFPGSGHLVVNVEGRGTARLDACGRPVWTVPRGGHHSVARAEDGTFWVPTRRFQIPLRSPDRPDGYPGLPRKGYHDFLVRLSPDGEVLRRLSVLEILYDNGLQRHVLKTRQHESDDVTHLNDIEPLRSADAGRYPLFQAGDLLVSLRNLDMVLVVDPRTGRVRWHATHPFLRQHDPDFVGDGWVGVFDNNWDATAEGSMLGGSRVVALRPPRDTQAVWFPTERSEALYTGAGGKWQRLANRNLLLTDTEGGRVLEVTPGGRTVWEWTIDRRGSSRAPDVYEGTRHDLSPEEVRAWPDCPDGEGAGRARDRSPSGAPTAGSG